MLRRTLVGIALVALLAPAAMGQTVDEIIAKNILAKGGLEKLKSYQAARVSGRMIMGQGMEMPFTNYQKRPKMVRTEFTFQGMKGIQAYDGKNGWMVMPFTGKTEPEAMPADQTAMVDEGADMDGPLMDYKEKGHTVELVGKEQVEGADAYKLKVTLKNGKVRYLYLDVESGLEVKSEGKSVMNGSEVESESYYGDYKQVAGIMMPFTVESGVKDSPMRRKMVVDSVLMNPALADSLFALPAGLASAGADSSKAMKVSQPADSTKAAAVTGKGNKAAKGAKAKKP